MFDRVEDTIVAISSPPGIGVRGIIRLSGPGSVDIARSVFESNAGEPLDRIGGHRRAAGRLRIDAGGWVPGEAYVFRAPASYTRQDVVEFHTVGSPVVLAMILEQLTSAGARAAEPGEFTARAFFAGSLDLVEVEGVAAMIQARNDSQLRAAEALLHGRLSRRSTELRDQLADLLALLEAEIDFVEESIEFVTTQQVIGSIDAVGSELDGLLGDAPDLERLDVLPRVLLVGPPNAGKSTLFNRLTGLDRAIQSATAGTTRDVLAAPLTVPGGEITLLDCAGVELLDEPGEARAEGVDALAEAATRRSVGSADLILLVLDATEWTDDRVSTFRANLRGRAVIVVANKVDVVTPKAKKNSDDREVTEVSALTGAGIDTLRERIGRAVFTQSCAHGEELLALSNRQRAALADARGALTRAAEMCRNAKELKSFAELLAVEVREAMDALSLLSGAIATEELLGRVFARFCIGK